jgi:hypothetical protein
MSEYVSRKSFLDTLAQVDYLKFGWIDLPWGQYVQDCEKAVEKHPDYFISLVDTGEQREVWDDESRKMFNEWNDSHRKHGYHGSNTRNWKTTVKKPKIDFAWEHDILAALPLENAATVTPTLMTPGNVMPWHYDKFYYMNRIVNEEQKEYVVRFLIFLEDWQSGHYLEAGRSIITGWRAGDIIVWHPNRGHLSSNVGLTNKWTCNVTGVLHEQIKLSNLAKI